MDLFAFFGENWGITGLVLLGIALYFWFGLWPFIVKQWWEHRKTLQLRKLDIEERRVKAQEGLVDTQKVMNETLKGVTDLLTTQVQKLAVFETSLDFVRRRNDTLISMLSSLLLDECRPVVGCIRYDVSGQIIDTDDNAPEILKTSRENLLKLNFHNPDIHIIDSSGRLMNSDRFPVCQALKTGKVARPMLLGYRGPDDPDHTIWLIDSARPIMQDGNIIGAISSFVDVSLHIETVEKELIKVNGNI